MSKRRRPHDPRLVADAEERAERLAPQAQRTAVIGIVRGRSPDGEWADVPAVLREPLVQPATWDDPDDTNIRSREPWQVRAYRRVDPLIGMHERGVIDRAMYDAAERFRDTMDSAEKRGARSMERVSTSGTPNGPAVEQLQALRESEAAFQALRRDNTQADLEIKDAVRHVVLGYIMPARYDAGRRVREGTARDRVVEGLRRLAVHYGLVAEG